MKTIETIEYTLPSYWASYLINGDASGLSDSEKADVDSFIAKESKPYPIYFVNVGEEAFFSRYCDAPGQLAGDMATFTAHILNK